MENSDLIITLFIVLFVYYLAQFYNKVSLLPRGPFPLPILGNILVFRGTKKSVIETINDLHQIYGSVFTIWLGTEPIVIISDYQMIKTVFNSPNNQLMGRPDVGLIKHIFNNGSDLFLSDYSPAYVSLRRVAHMAIRKLAAIHDSCYLVDDVVSESVDSMIRNEGIGKAFNPSDYIYLTVFNIIASSTFGKRDSVNDGQLLFNEKILMFIQSNVYALILTDKLPIVKPFYNNLVNSVRQTLKTFIENIKEKYTKRLEVHQKGVIHDFVGALIEAKEQAIGEVKERAQHLDDTSLALLILDLFLAGTVTVQYTLRWIFLLMANYPQMQNRMRDEVNSIIGSRIAVQEDRKSCHYINAFIAEVLRFTGTVQMAVPHKALCDYRFENYWIPKDSIVLSNLIAMAKNPMIWPQPELFNPNRFLTADNKFVSDIRFTAFGIGKRKCLGERLGLDNLFLMTVRLLKSTSGYTILLPGGQGSACLEPNPDIMFLSTPKTFEIIIEEQCKTVH